MEKKNISSYLTFLKPLPTNLKYPLTVYFFSKDKANELEDSIFKTSKIFKVKDSTIKESLARRLGTSFTLVRELLKKSPRKYLKILFEYYPEHKKDINEIVKNIDNGSVNIFH